MIQTKHRHLLMATLGLVVWGAAILFGRTVEAQEEAASTPEELRRLTPEELEELAAPIALYPDDLVSIVLPASTYPLQIVQAARYLERHTADPALEPDEDWDDSVVALLNYPEVIDLMNVDLDWTWELGRAVLYQNPELMDAIQNFRRRAYAAGNLESDDHQVVTSYEETIVIELADPTVIYVPYYEPETVVIYHSYPVYHYYPRPYPVYYYPYPVGHWSGFGFFWGVTLAFSIDWHSHHVHAYHHRHHAHPYYGHDYHHASYRHRSVSRSYSASIWRPGRKSGSRQLHVASAHLEDHTPSTTKTRKGKHSKQAERQHRSPKRKSGGRSAGHAAAAHGTKRTSPITRAKPGFQKHREDSAKTGAGGSRKAGGSKGNEHRSRSAAKQRLRTDPKRVSPARRYAGHRSTQSSGSPSGRGGAHKGKDRPKVTSPGNVSRGRNVSRSAFGKVRTKSDRSNVSSRRNVSAGRSVSSHASRSADKRKSSSGPAPRGGASPQQRGGRAESRKSGISNKRAARSTSSSRSGRQGGNPSGTRSSFVGRLQSSVSGSSNRTRGF